MASAASPGMSMNMSGSSSSSRAVVGDTLGWFAGHTSLLHYTKNYFCRTPPSSRVSSDCEALQCPVAGNCVDHPHTIDLTRVLGAGTGNALLPAHSHIVTTANMNKPEYWDVIVVGVTKSSSWYKIVQGKDLSTVRMLQKDKSNGVTPFIPDQPVPVLLGPADSVTRTPGRPAPLPPWRRRAPVHLHLSAPERRPSPRSGKD